MFDAGLAILCACLPTLNAPMTGINANAFIRSVRSALSIESLRSRGSGGTIFKDTQYPKYARSLSNGTSTSSRAKITNASFRKDLNPDCGVETHVMSDLERRPDVPEGQIFVQRELAQWQLSCSGKDGEAFK